jgi:hypothetical protein
MAAKSKISFLILFFLLLSASALTQTTYEVTPGVKNNQIVLQLANISQTESADDIHVKLVKSSDNLEFNKNEIELQNINSVEEKEVTFSFDVKYNAVITKPDTITFLVTGSNNVYLTKEFVLRYTAPTEYKLEQNYPNPFNPATKIRFTIPNVETRHASSLQTVSLKVFDILGNEVTTLINEPKETGYYEVEFNASSFASGVYIYRLSVGKFVSTKKMVLLK